MAFFDGLGKKITETVDVVGRKTNDLVEIQKLRSQISNLEKNIDKNYIELGKLLFEQYQNGETLSEEAKDYFDEITGSTILIDEYEQEIAEIKGLKKCTGCGENLAPDAAYCPKCGKKAEDIAEEEEPVDAEEDIFEEEAEIIHMNTEDE